MPNLCPQLIPLYTQWKQSLEDLSQARVRFMETGDKGDHQSVVDLQVQVESARQAYGRGAYETLVSYGENDICALEATIAEVMDQRMLAGGGDGFTFVCDWGHVTEVIPWGNTSDNIDHALSIIGYLSGLTALSLDGTKVSKLENLPDSLTSISLVGTELSVLPDILPNALEGLHLTNSKVRTIPVKLPDSLKALWLAGTPAAKDQQIVERLEARREQDPYFYFEV